jgi:phosphoglycolate phosphatase-like HAD superfamily hydrolase
MSKRLLEDLLSPYDVIALDCGGVLHLTSYQEGGEKSIRDIVVNEMTALTPLIERLSKHHILVLVCNSTKSKICDFLLRSKLGKYFDKMYISPNKSPKVPRLERIMRDFKTDKIILLDDKMRNIEEARKNDISALQIHYDELVLFI